MNLSEFRDGDVIRQYVEIKRTATRPWTIMEVCGGQTHSLVKNGILQLLPDKVRMAHGPGCPVCVTPLNQINKAVFAAEKGAILCSYGDMLRVPGSHKVCWRQKPPAPTSGYFIPRWKPLKSRNKTPTKKWSFLPSALKQQRQPTPFLYFTPKEPG